MMLDSELFLLLDYIITKGNGGGGGYTQTSSCAIFSSSSHLYIDSLLTAYSLDRALLPLRIRRDNMGSLVAL